MHGSTRRGDTGERLTSRVSSRLKWAGGAVFVAALVAGRPVSTGWDGPRPAQRCRLTVGPLVLRGGGFSGDGDSDEVLEILPQPRSMKRKGIVGAQGPGRPSCAPRPAWVRARTGGSATSPTKSPSKEKRRHLPLEKWVDYPEDGGGQDYQGNPVFMFLDHHGNVCAMLPVASHTDVPQKL